MAAENTRKFAGLLRRLRRDTAGNTLALTAASIVPLVGMIGGGLDMSRNYLAKSRLQQACDAATLAARKELGNARVESGDPIPTNITSTADNYFNLNFKDGSYGTTGLSYALSTPDGSVMQGNASVAVPTTLMSVFGVDQANISVSCQSDLTIPNVDIMLVLDVTGSMNGRNPGESIRKIDGLKNAVKSFYDEIAAVAPPQSRIRYGFVPYNGSVNVGEIIRDVDPSYLADSWTYQSREAQFVRVSNDDGIEEGDELSREIRDPFWLSYSNIDPDAGRDFWYASEKSDCEGLNGNYTFGRTEYQVRNADLRRIRSTNPGWLCYTRTTIIEYAGPDDTRPDTYRDEFDRYQYKPITFDTSNFKGGNWVRTQTGTQGADRWSRWNNCIEERQTVRGNDFSPIPANAYDLQIDLLPHNDETRWKPMWPEISFDRDRFGVWNTTNRLDDMDARGRFNCPRAAEKLAEYPPRTGGSAAARRNTAFNNYVNSLSPGGGTLHDIGMIWGARMISPTGLLASENATAPNGEAIARHIVFMTDGEMGASQYSTTAYGNATMEDRIVGNNAQNSENFMANFHNTRMVAACQAAKNRNVTIWTVSFGVGLTSQMRDCATGSRHFTADNSTALTDAFRSIASSIAELRLVE